MKKSADRLPIRQRLDRLSMPVPEAGCWLWLGTKLHNGYGMFNLAGKLTPAHRVAWQEFNGPIPDGLCVCHKCDTRSCVNPSHLFIGTRSDNMRDMVTKGRNIYPDGKGSRNPMAKLTDAQVQAIISDARYQRVIAADYGIRQSTVSRLKAGVRWRHLG